MSKIKELCNKYTNLTDDDILILIDFEKSINTMAQLVKADIFIDCITKDKNRAIVVAQSKYDDSLYTNSVVGKFAYRKDEPAVLRSLELDVYVKEFKGLSQEKFSIDQTVTPIKNGDKVIGALIMEVPYRKNSENEIVVSNDYVNIENNIDNDEFEISNNKFIDYVTFGVVIFDSRQNVVYANEKAVEIYQKLGYINDILSLHYEDLAFHKLSKNEFDAELIKEFDVDIGKLALNVRYIKTDKNNLATTMIIKDLTEVKRKEQELIVKSVAINEINHRVKNNLQTIISLLNLQARRFEDKEVFLDCINRVNSVAIIHELITNNENKKININMLCKKLIEIFRSYDSSKTINFTVCGDDIFVNGDIASAVSMFVTEALQNVSKHAFPNIESGNVKINIVDNDLSVEFSICDDGVGFDFNNINKNSLGISIMNGIVEEKLNSKLVINSNEKGTTLKFEVLK